MMAEEKKVSCYCGGVMAIIIAVLTVLAMGGTVTSSWLNIVVLVLAILIAIGSFAGGCLCTKLCKPKS